MTKTAYASGVNSEIIKSNELALNMLHWILESVQGALMEPPDTHMDFLKRLETVFPHVAKRPLPLFNSANCPLYLLCFAAGNPGSGGKTGLKIAQDILKP